MSLCLIHGFDFMVESLVRDENVDKQKHTMLDNCISKFKRSNKVHL